MAVLMPITSPCMLNSGPPELPGLIGASVWMKSSKGPAPMSRPRAETMPAVTDAAQAEGIARRQHPLPDPHVAGRAERHGRQRRARRDPQQREVGQVIRADHPRDVVGAVLRGDRHARGVADDMAVGDDDAGRFDDEARPGALHQLPAAAAFDRPAALLGRHLLAAGHLDADHGGQHAFGQVGEVGQAALRRGRGRAGGQRGRQQQREATRQGRRIGRRLVEWSRGQSALAIPAIQPEAAAGSSGQACFG